MPPVVDITAVDAANLVVDVILSPSLAAIDVVLQEQPIIAIDVIGGEALLSYANLPAELQTLPISFSFVGTPDVMTNVNVPMAFALTVPASLIGTKVYAGTTTTANAVFTLNRVRGVAVTALGTITITSASHTSCTLAGAGGALITGDVLQIVGPAANDATLGDVGITVLAQRV